MTDSYKAAYERQKKAREIAEKLLEERSRELYESNLALKDSYEKLKSQKTQIYHQDKLASVGMLGAGVAHEINNPIGFIKSNIVSLKGYLAKITQFQDVVVDELNNHCPSEALQAVESLKEELDLNFILKDIGDLFTESLEGVERIEVITKSMKEFSRPDLDDNENFDLNKSIRSALVISQNQTKNIAEIETHFGDIPFICGKSGSVSQVVLNLVINAADALEEYGKITVATGATEEEVYFSVEDTGHGIAEENLSTIFDPFYTTKELGKGTGLGLSVSHNIVRQHEGRILVQSEVGVGTTFTVYFPRKTCDVG